MIVCNKGETAVHGTFGQARGEFTCIVKELLDSFTKEKLHHVIDVVADIKEGGEQRADNESRWNGGCSI